MNLQFFKKKASPPKDQSLYRVFSLDGLHILKDCVGLDATTAKTSRQVDAVATTALVEQLEEEGLAVTQEAGVLISWEQLYSLLENPAYFSSLPILDLPPIAAIAPILKSQNSLADLDFAITIGGWADPNGRDLGSLPLTGAAVKLEEGFALLGKPSWAVLQGIATFHQRADKDKNDIYHRMAWGQIRQKALLANSRLDDFLYRSVVLTPEKLDIDLRRADIGGTKVVEVAPGFAGAPSNWLELFDKQKGVPDRYDFPTAEGILQILITPQVKTVLEQIKRFEKRRVAGGRAEAFVINPFAALGEDAVSVIDPIQFENAREKSGLLFDSFTASIQLDAVGYPEKIGILIESASGSEIAESGVHFFENDRQLEQFIQLAERNLDKNLQFCGWGEYEFELLGDSPGELAKLKKALEQQRQPRVLVSYAHVYDLSRYSSRVEDIGLEKVYYSPFITKKNDEDGWFPENLIPVISYTPEGDLEPVAIPITPQAREQLEAKLAEAKAAGENEFSLKGFPKPITVKEADAILHVNQRAKLTRNPG